MDVISEGGLAATALMVMLLDSWIIIATAPRYPYVSPVEYDSIDFNLNNWTPEHLRRTMRFTKEEISLLISYLDLESIVYRQRIDAFI